MPEGEWIIQRGEERYPVADIGMIRDWAQKGNLLATDQIWSPVKSAWVMARDMSELSDVMVLPATTAAPAPQPITPAAVNAIGIRVAAYLIDVVPAIILGLICGVIGLIPIIGWIVLIVFYVREGDAGENKYGPPPGSGVSEPTGVSAPSPA